MNGVRTTFMRRGYLLTALSAAAAACGVCGDGVGAGHNQQVDQGERLDAPAR